MPTIYLQLLLDSLLHSSLIQQALLFLPLLRLVLDLAQVPVLGLCRFFAYALLGLECRLSNGGGVRGGAGLTLFGGICLCLGLALIMNRTSYFRFSLELELPQLSNGVQIATLELPVTLLSGVSFQQSMLRLYKLMLFGPKRRLMLRLGEIMLNLHH